MKIKSLVKISCAPFVMMILPAVAGDAVGPGDSDSKFVLGAGAVSYTNIYAGEESEESLWLNFRYNGERFFIKDGTFNLHFTEFDEVSVALLSHRLIPICLTQVITQITKTFRAFRREMEH